MTLMEGYKIKITKDTSDFINTIKKLFRDSIKKLDDALVEYQALLNKQYFDQKTKDKIENIIKGYIDPFNIEKSLTVHESAINYYNTDFLKEVEFIQTNAAERFIQNIIFVSRDIHYMFIV